MSMIKTEQEKAINELLEQKIASQADLAKAKRQMARKYGLGILLNSVILKQYKKLIDENTINHSPCLEKVLRKRPIRTLSGIAAVAVLTKPYPCPGKCAYCPTEEGVPKSYLSNEPAVMRAIRCHYDPYLQVQLRLKALEANGHQPEKIELIVIGGTWSVLPRVYKYWFIKECFRAANNYKSVILEGAQRPTRLAYALAKRVESRRDPIAPPQMRVRSRMTVLKKILNQEQKRNEKTIYRIIGITLETRPDYIDEAELLEMRELGCTRVELGVQAIDDKILKLNKRGHGVKEIVQATGLLKDFGFKVTYHLMPGLPGSNPQKDLLMFKQLFKDQRFQPDQIKFYPTIVTRGGLLYRWWKEKKYRPYSDKVLQNLIVDCKKLVPPYVRIIRLIRDIPSESIMAGNTITNLRQVLQQRGAKCKCIRCREARGKKFEIGSLKFVIRKYQASEGREYFISYESQDGETLYGFCRLRLPDQKSPQPPLLKGASLIRELHIYGELVPIGGQQKVQHTGLGKKLLQQAELIAKKQGYKKLAIIAGVGARQYFGQLGYQLVDSYMVKDLL